MSTTVHFLLHSSLRGSVLILAVLLLRFLLHRIPKRYTCFLWTAVWLRLALPFAVRSRFSLLPSWLSTGQAPAAVPEQTATIAKPVSVAPGTAVSASTAAHLDYVLLIWITGLALLMIFALVRYLLLKRRVREAIPFRDKLWLCDWVESPFVLGLFRPRIYLSSGVEERDIPWISAHEEAHLRRRDPWRKLGAFLLTAIYWFQPLVWAAFFLYQQDLELACDEQAIRGYDSDARNAYVGALLRASMPGRSVWVAPLGFGSAPVKRRVEAMLHPRRCGRARFTMAALFSGILLLALTVEPVRAEQALPRKEPSAVLASAATPAQSQPDISESRLSLEKEAPHEETGALVKETTAPREEAELSSMGYEGQKSFTLVSGPAKDWTVAIRPDGGVFILQDEVVIMVQAEDAKTVYIIQPNRPEDTP
ncbi:MAG: hypothetical protein IJL66_08865 [Lachnospiraceae bacterium]|nr:hypothetical protein [Lachnospiraceae bacterium]